MLVNSVVVWQLLDVLLQLLGCCWHPFLSGIYGAYMVQKQSCSMSTSSRPKGAVRSLLPALPHSQRLVKPLTGDSPQVKVAGVLPGAHRQALVAQPHAILCGTPHRLQLHLIPVEHMANGIMAWEKWGPHFLNSCMDTIR